MKPKAIFTLTILLIVIVLSITSCYTGSVITAPTQVNPSTQKQNQFYAKTAINVPLLSEKNDITASGMISAGNSCYGKEAQAAFMPGKNMGIMASYSEIKNGSSMDFTGWELGVGYVTSVAPHVHFETYAGIGNGKIENEHETGTSSLKLTHYFIQPAIAISNTKKTVQFAFVSKLSGANFHLIDTTFNNVLEPINTEQINNLYNRPFHFILEPGFVFRFGWKYVLFYTGYSFASDFTNSHINGSKGNFSFGITTRLNATKRHKD